jgi:hypothetical protein
VTSESDGSSHRSSRIVTQPINVGRGAGAVAVGPAAVWVANRVDGTVNQVDPAGTPSAPRSPSAPGRAGSPSHPTARRSGSAARPPAPCRRSSTTTSSGT